MDRCDSSITEFITVLLNWYSGDINDVTQILHHLKIQEINSPKISSSFLSIILVTTYTSHIVNFHTEKKQRLKISLIAPSLNLDSTNTTLFCAFLGWQFLLYCHLKTLGRCQILTWKCNSKAMDTQHFASNQTDNTFYLSLTDSLHNAQLRFLKEDFILNCLSTNM